MKHSVQATTTLRARPTLSERWGRLFGNAKTLPTYSVQISDIELRRSGHVTTNVPDALRTREEFRSIKRQVVAHLREGTATNGRDSRVILVASARPGEGKTFVALNLALSLSLDRTLNVTLIDGDILSQGLSDRFNLARASGLLDVLDRSDSNAPDAMQDTNLENLQVIPAGRQRPDGTELLAGEGMSRLLSTILGGSPNHVVVLDSGSLLSESAPAILATLAGQVVFVIGSNETGRGVINEALAVLDGQIGPLELANLGLVLNKISSANSTVRYSTT